MKILITGACAVTARTILRGLKMSPEFKNAEFIGWDMCGLLYGVYSKAFDKMYKVPGVNDPAYEEIVRKILADERPDATIIVPEVEVRYWANHELGVPCLLPPGKFADIAVCKDKLFAALRDTDLVPSHLNASAGEIKSQDFNNTLGFPVWIRDGAAGTASARGAFKAFSNEDLRAWVQVNNGIDMFQLSEYLPGKIYACVCLYKDGVLKKVCLSQRIEYIMSKVAVSGITGNICKGKLINDRKVVDTAIRTIETLCAQTGEVPNGIIDVDMRDDVNGNPKVTEINMRFLSFSSVFASAGWNLFEDLVKLTLNRDDEVSPEIEKQFPESNWILRDVDGEPVYVENPVELKMGDCFRK